MIGGIPHYRERVRRVGDLVGTAVRARRSYDDSLFAVVRRLRSLRSQGFTYAEALGHGLIDPSLDEGVRNEHISQHVRQERQRQLNAAVPSDPTRDKLTVALLGEGWGLPFPKTFGTVGRSGVWDKGSATFSSDPGALGRLVRYLPDDFVIKPVAGYLGTKVHRLRRTKGGAVDAAGVSVNLRQLQQELSDDPEFDLFIVQERLHNHASVDALNSSRALQTVRITTLIDIEGRVHVLFAIWKVARGETVIDNFNDGRSGNALAYVDVSSGVLRAPHVARPDGLGTVAVGEVEGRALTGARLPLFDSARELVKNAAPLYLPLRALGWDVALTPSGPVILEVNSSWGTAHEPLPHHLRDLFLND